MKLFAFSLIFDLNSCSETFLYNGDFKNGMLNGFITKTAKNGAVIYKGMYLNNRKNGAGKSLGTPPLTKISCARTWHGVRTLIY